MIVVDTGVLLAVGNATDSRHGDCLTLLQTLVDEGRELLIPAPVFAETCIMLERKVDARAELKFVQEVNAGTFILSPTTAAELARIQELVTQYIDFPLGVVDASVVALAERLRIGEVATLDHRHFRSIRPHHLDAFSLLP